MLMNKTFQIKFDNKLIAIILLLIALLVTIAFWQPWQTSSAAERTLAVTGEATVSDTPNQYDFYPTYQESGTNRQATLEKVNTQVNTVIEELKKLGVSEDKISLSENSYRAYWVDDKSNTISVTVTVEVEGKDLAQKVQDYLITTTPSGQITPYPTFTKDKLKSLQDQARTNALKDAKNKAESTVSEVGARLGKVVSISDNQYVGIMPMIGVAESSDSSKVNTSLPVSTSKQDVSVSVQVTYELR